MKDIFLSHNRADKAWVRKLAERIEAETWNGRKLSVFFDEWDIRPGENIITKIDEGLRESRFYGVVLSPEMVSAPWPTMEWTAAVTSDPAGRAGRVIPVLCRNCEIPWPIRPLSYLDFRDPKQFEAEFRRLLHRLKNEAPPRGDSIRPATVSPAAMPIVVTPIAQAKPDPVQEALFSNLLPVVDHPTTVWSAATEMRLRGQVFEKLKPIVAPPFKLAGGRLYTFNDLTGVDNPFKALCSSPPESHQVGALWQDLDKRKWIISLLNQALNRHCEGRGLHSGGRFGRFFFPPEDGKDRILRWKPGRLRVKRTVAKRCIDIEGKTVFWVHHSAWLGIVTLGDKLYLHIRPGWLFTDDGTTVKQGPNVGPLTTRWGGRERNGAILRHTCFWSWYLAQGQSELHIAAGNSQLRIKSIPAVAVVPVGILEDGMNIESFLAPPVEEADRAAKVRGIEGAEEEDFLLGDEDAQEA